MASMPFFVCVRCGRRLTAAVAEVPLPPPAVEEESSTERFLPARMTAGTYAVNAQTGGFVFHPDDITGTDLHPDPRRRNGCCGLDGLDGPNLVCAGCGAEIATKQSDCWSQQQVTLPAAAARPVAGR
jgi:hypothetical protein